MHSDAEKVKECGMRFFYADEALDRSRSDVLVVAGIMTAAEDRLGAEAEIKAILSRVFRVHGGQEVELKTSRFMRGLGGWRRVGTETREEVLQDICKCVTAFDRSIYGIGVSLESLDSERLKRAEHDIEMRDYVAAGMFICSLIQKKMQILEDESEKVTVVFDEGGNTKRINELLKDENEWYDGLCQVRQTHSKGGIWLPRDPEDRFDHIAYRSVFSKDSKKAFLIQAADAISYIYRRHLELMSGSAEIRSGERKFIDSLIDILEPRREKLGDAPNADCVNFYNSIKHPNWEL